MLEELKAKMEQHREENLMKNQEFMQELNLKRFEFDKAEEKITLQKLVHDALVKRGMNFLAEVELGNGPPIEYVVKNIHVDEKELKKSKIYDLQRCRSLQNKLLKKQNKSSNMMKTDCNDGKEREKMTCSFSKNKNTILFQCL